MSKRLIDVEQSNLYLFNLLFRHQVYLEGVKVGFASNFKRVISNLYDEFAKYIGQTQYDKLDGFTKAEINNFIRRFKLAQTHVYNQYTQQLIQLLKQFVSADLEVSNAIYSAVSGKPASEKPSLQADSLWATISNAPIPANGMTISQMLNGFTSTSITKVSQQLMMGYANGDSGRDTLALIAGSNDAGFRDGLFTTFSNSNNSIIATALQHVSSILQSSIASEHYDEYQWVAILDSRTTLICRSRDGKVYVYGEGPLPPAHYNCRSKAVSLINGKELHNIPATFYAWLSNQPVDVLMDMLGSSMAARVIAGTPSVQDISISDVVIPLTLDQFRKKIAYIL